MGNQIFVIDYLKIDMELILNILKFKKGSREIKYMKQTD